MSDEPDQTATSYSEHDKLGPLGARASVLGGGGGDLRAALLGEFRDAVHRARTAAGSVGAGASGAVHEYRKGLRTARAVLALIEDALPRSERRAIRQILRDARRAVSAARDQAVAPDALALLTLEDSERITAEAVLAVARAAAPPTDEVARVLAEGAGRAVAQVEALDAALPPTIAWDLVSDGIAATYREARAKLKKARRSWRAFHAWRRRTKELTYQLDLISKHAGERTAALRDKYDGIADALGGAVDLIMLREVIVTHGAGLDSDRTAELLGRIDDQIDAAVRTARREGKELFARGPRKFARKVSKAAKKDLAPRTTPANGAPAPGASA
jgi:CHAD domain-containing protein